MGFSLLLQEQCAFVLPPPTHVSLVLSNYLVSRFNRAHFCRHHAESANEKRGPCWPKEPFLTNDIAPLSDQSPFSRSPRSARHPGLSATPTRCPHSEFLPLPARCPGQGHRVEPTPRIIPLTQVHSTVLSVTGYRTNYRTESMMVMRVVGDLVHLFSSSQKSLGNQICLPVDSLHTDDTDVLAAAFCSGEKQLFGYT